MTELLQALKTLADETRLNLVKLLLTHDLCVGALARRLGVSEAAVSQHLGRLREAGLVRGEKRGYWTHYAVERDKLDELAGLLRELTALPPCPEGAAPRTWTNGSTASRRT
jgi:DNA-binding transcriptional ArsR family regulator